MSHFVLDCVMPPVLHYFMGSHEKAWHKLNTWVNVTKATSVLVVQCIEEWQMNNIYLILNTSAAEVTLWDGFSTCCVAATDYDYWVDVFTSCPASDEIVLIGLFAILFEFTKTPKCCAVRPMCSRSQCAGWCSERCSGAVPGTGAAAAHTFNENIMNSNKQ